MPGSSSAAAVGETGAAAVLDPEGGAPAQAVTKHRVAAASVAVMGVVARMDSSVVSFLGPNWGDAGNRV